MTGCPSAAQVARQLLRSAVNFGVASVARVRGASKGEILVLRCECGGCSCADVVQISLGEYQDARLDGALLVVREHVRGDCSVVGGSDAWVVVARDAAAGAGV